MTDELSIKIQQWTKNPNDFRLIERIPFTKNGNQWPQQLFELVGDEIEMVILDTETTGLLADEEAIIELGMVKVMYSKSKNRISSIVEVISLYEDPQKPIPENITRLTGITNEMVTGQSIDDAWVADWLSNSSLIVAHNAKFDRPFFEQRFPQLHTLCWACSFQGIDWTMLGFESRKLKYLLQDSGWFYEGHRASIDCLAVAWLLYNIPESMVQLLQNARKKSVLISAIGAPFDAKDQLKSHGYRWNNGDKGQPKHWWIEIPNEDLLNEKIFLQEVYPQFEQNTIYEIKNARNRFKSE